MQVPIQNLRCNIAQMRSRCNAHELAQLAVQVQGGLHPSLHLIVKAREDGAYDVISGHRRWMALMIAHLAIGGKSTTPEGDLAVAKAFIAEHFSQHGDGWIYLWPETYAKMSQECQGLEVPVEVWDGSKADEILLLLGANVGAEEPDLVGMGKSFIRAMEADVPLAQLAQAVGKPVAMVEAIAEIPLLSETFQQLILDGRLDLSVVPDIVRLEGPQMRGLNKAIKIYLKETDRERQRENLSNAVRVCLGKLDFTPGDIKREDVSPDTYNEYAILSSLWALAMKENPAAICQHLCEQALRGYSKINLESAFLRALSKLKSVKPYVEEGRAGSFGLSEKALEFIPQDVTCETCIFGQLPDKKLRWEFDVPCREGAGRPECGRCMDGVPASAKFDIRLSWNWLGGNAGRHVHSAKELITAWHEQEEAEKPRLDDEGRVVGIAGRQKEDISGQRMAIELFMTRHVQAPFLLDHPWATACARCKWHLEASPVKSDPEAPHCRWAKGKHNLGFDAYVPSDNEIMVSLKKKLPAGGAGQVPLQEWEDFDPASIEFMVPSCRQYSPIQPWAELIPESPGCTWSREAILDCLVTVAREGNRNLYASSSRAICQWLTGRPETENSQHGHSFSNALKANQDSLSDAQLWTLLHWALLEFDRVTDMGNKIYLPLPGGGSLHTQFIGFQSALSLLEP